MIKQDVYKRQPYSSNEALTRVNGEYGENMAGYFSVALLARSSSDFDAIRSELDQQVRRYNDSKTDYNVGFPSGLLSQLDTAMGCLLYTSYRCR